ncbi:MAG: tRNA 2-thiouridine(34) synthase MnmA, partial [Acidobacteria bacterium]|nr:tRNA 2-thiouridine(34) synthase MnmA [Acidobacteriota bacterium]
GQRKGLGIATGQPLYVIQIDTAARKLIVGQEQNLYSQTCLVCDVNWIAIESFEPGLRASLRAEVKIRHQHTPAPATLFAEGHLVRVRFDSPQRAVTPGQAAVFYQDDLVLGGGWIEQSEPRQ